MQPLASIPHGALTDQGRDDGSAVVVGAGVGAGVVGAGVDPGVGAGVGGDGVCPGTSGFGKFATLTVPRSNAVVCVTAQSANLKRPPSPQLAPQEFTPRT